MERVSEGDGDSCAYRLPFWAVVLVWRMIAAIPVISFFLRLATPVVYVVLFATGDKLLEVESVVLDEVLHTTAESEGKVEDLLLRMELGTAAQPLLEDATGDAAESSQHLGAESTPGRREKMDRVEETGTEREKMDELEEHGHSLGWRDVQSTWASLQSLHCCSCTVQREDSNEIRASPCQRQEEVRLG
eukprot:gnl/TRDRNA2_/TRDRNA2_161420_c3_seq3.p1 gnl/TRDRNA2_/TRDRNA2_161420_c3~~gnl/TRDRNA2_/TRDRNA2_161420_c3_seq3.p1  ORF type:complete len:189 (+),score=22.40 gnl/TRDRNA2_/TRDRNA2_161420_c3_seq3:16-582(+)